MRIILLFILASCQSVPVYAGTTYKHNLKTIINGETYKGYAILPASDKYKITVDGADDNIDRIFWQTCHQEQVIDKPRTGWFNNKYTFDYVRSSQIEKTTACPLTIAIVTQSNQKIGLSIFDFPDSRKQVNLEATSQCNGELSLLKGVGICQSAHGLMQSINFNVEVIQAGATDGCNVFSDKKNTSFTYKISEGKCVYYFGAKDGSLFRLTTIGYTEVTPK